MTTMRVTHVGVSLTAEQKQSAASRLIAAFASVECGQDMPAAHGGFLVQFEAVEADDLYMGDAPMSAASPVGRACLVTARVMAGPWTNEMKAQVFEAIEGVIRAEFDMPRPDSGADFWMTILEVPEGAWGYGGRPVSIGSLAPAFTEDRQERIRTHLGSD